MAEAAFVHAALRYCDVKVQAVDLQRLIRLAPCEWGRDVDCEVCWVEMDVGNFFNLDEACENCQMTYPLLEQRRALGKRLPNLAKKMYAAFRNEMEGLDADS